MVVMIVVEMVVVIVVVMVGAVDGVVVILVVGVSVSGDGVGLELKVWVESPRGVSPDSVSYWGSYFKYSKRCMCALSSLGAAGCRCCVCVCGSLGAGAAAVCDCCVRVGAWALVPLLCAAAARVCELGCWCHCCVLLLCARGSLGAGAAAVCCCVCVCPLLFPRTLI